MSLITTVLLSVSVDDDDDGQLARDLVVPDGYDSRFVDASMVDAAWGGTKPPMATVYAGAFNYLRCDELLKLLAEWPWRQPERVQLFIRREGADTFTVFTGVDAIRAQLEVPPMLWEW